MNWEAGDTISGRIPATTSAFWPGSRRVRACALSYAECGVGLYWEGCVCTCLGCAEGWRLWCCGVEVVGCTYPRQGVHR